MKRSHVFSTVGLIVLLLIVAFTTVPAWAQEDQVTLRSVNPNSGRAGEELGLTIRGGGFCDPAQVRIGEFQAGGVEVESDSTIHARIYIPQDAGPGPRDVEVVVDCGGPEETFGAMLPGGFTVLEPADDGGRVDEGGDDGGDEGGYDDYSGGFDGWLLLVVILAVVGVIVVGGGALTVTLAARARRISLENQAQMQQEMEQLQEEAEEGELPEKCQSGKHKVIRDKPEIKPGLWKVAGLKVALYDAARVQQGAGDQGEKERDAPEELVARIDKAARDRLLWGDSEKLAVEIVGIGRALTAQVIAWQALSEAGHDIYLEPAIEGGEASVRFTLYRCVGEPDWWQKIKSWQAKAQAVKHFQKKIRGPVANESSEAYRAVLEKELSIYVYKLIREASRLWDTEGVGVSVEVSLK